MLSQGQALLLSVGIEVPCALALGHARGWMPAKHRWAWVLAAVAATLITHPFAWSASLEHHPHLTPEGKALRIEAAVVLAEAVIYAAALRVSPGRAFALALAANVASFGIGLLWV